MKENLKKILKNSAIISGILSLLSIVFGYFNQFAFIFGCGAFIDCRSVYFLTSFFFVLFIPLFILGSLIGWIVWKIKGKK